MTAGSGLYRNNGKVNGNYYSILRLAGKDNRASDPPSIGAVFLAVGGGWI